jgi:glycosyltransferase involved in cell wall biosynthesis
MSKQPNLKFVLVLQVLDKINFLDIEKFIKKYSLEKKIIIFSNLSINELPELYKNAEVYIYSSYCEVFGLTTIEAMSQRTPVVASNTSAIPEINKKAAKYFNPDNIKNIKNTLENVLLNKNFKKKLIKESVKLLKRYDNNKNIKKTINIIQNFN